MGTRVGTAAGFDASFIPLVEHIRREIPEVLAIYAYGSRARGEPQTGSDLDIALLLPRDAHVSPLVLAQLQGDLEALSGYPVEISVLSLDLQVVHCKEVVTRGKAIFVADTRAVDDFEMRTLSSYARLCEDRAPVLEAYSKAHDG
ncbi:MAG TPA: nucleotidyltransferase domain-containing protein [Acidobacteriota bacterium]|nr:nucleotidyltransferase domain-containing protein [Acidobacteriota bacterium]